LFANVVGRFRVVALGQAFCIYSIEQFMLF
jgi:hypothetical protein